MNNEGSDPVLPQLNAIIINNTMHSSIIEGTNDIEII